MAEKRNNEGSFVNAKLPARVGARDAVRYFTSKDGKELADVTLPGYFEIEVDGERKDASYHHIVVPRSMVHTFENSPDTVSVGFPERNSKGEAWEIAMKRDLGNWENPEAEGAERGKFVVEGVSEIKANPAQFKQAASEHRQAALLYRAKQDAERGKVRATILRKAGSQTEAMHTFKGKDGKLMADITLPPGFVVIDADGKERDASFHHLVVPRNLVDFRENDPGYMEVTLFEHKTNGEPSYVALRKAEGDWEHPEAEGADRGKFVTTGESKVVMDARSFAQASQNVRESRQAWYAANMTAKGQAKAVPEKKPAAKKSPETAEKSARSQAKAAKTETPEKTRKQTV